MQTGFFNVHHSYNLRLKGRNITTHAILNSRKDNIFYHGTTLHKISPELDSGEIVASRTVRIDGDDTAYTLFRKVDELAYELLIEWLPRLISENIILYVPPEKQTYSFRAKDLPSKELSVKELDELDFMIMLEHLISMDMSPLILLSKT